MLYNMPVAGKLKLKCPRFPYSSSSTHDLASTKLIHLLNIIKAAVMTVFLLFLPASLILEVIGYSAASSFYFCEG